MPAEIQTGVSLTCYRPDVCSKNSYSSLDYQLLINSFIPYVANIVKKRIFQAIVDNYLDGPEALLLRQKALHLFSPLFSILLKITQHT
jgi:hypothetical protein